jgi:tRNA G10  N-methylase Trm11
MKAQYIVHLGKNRTLSLSEIEATTGEVPVLAGNAALLGKLPTSPKKFLNQLGGAIKLSEIVWDGPGEADIIAQELQKQKPEGKLAFGINIYPENRKKLDTLLRAVKKVLKTNGRNSRFPNKGGNLSSATIVKGGLMKHQTDFNLIQIDNQTLISRTVAVQDFEGYSQRDYEKPARLAKAGMLPPKLAQTMINMSQLVTGPCDLTNQTVYDPFCGSGTILGEGLIKEMHVIGSDLSEEAIEAAQINLPWIKQKFHTPGNHTLFLKDATQLTKADLPTPPDMVITETYLGPPRSVVLSPEKIYEFYDDLMPLYLNFLETIHPLLNPKTPLVIAFPVYHAAKGPIRLPKLVEQILPIGYKLNRELIYHRSDQVVGRHILILEHT